MLLKKLTTNLITGKWKEIFNHNVDCLNDLETSLKENDDYLSNPTQKPESNNSSTSFFQRIIAMIRNFFAKLFKF